MLTKKPTSMQLSLSMAEASKTLTSSLRTISPDAFRVVSKTDCYGDIHIGENETTFTIGVGPTGYTTAIGKITAIGPDTSEISYTFKGPFWSLMTRDIINSHIIKTFKTFQLNTK
ncbi:hypothetical protein ACFL1E_05890 [Candidatus Omnitrophota bacterium]